MPLGGSKTQDSIKQTISNFRIVVNTPKDAIGNCTET